MIKTFCEDLYGRFMADLQTAVTLSEKLAVVRRYLRGLAEYVDTYVFADTAEEIWYFKSEQPRFYRWQYYQRDHFYLGQARPKNGPEALREFLTAQLAYYERFRSVQQFWYGYYREGASELDGLVFVRAGKHAEALFAQLMAVDLLVTEIEKELRALDQEELRPPLSSTMVDPKGRLLKPLRWTGEPINLKELAYAIWLRKQVNEGEIGIVALFKQLGDLFGVDLGIPKSALDDMMGRKKLSKTRFLDELTAALLQKMDEEDSWPGHPGKNKTGY